jgi:hypothetical protein
MLGAHWDHGVRLPALIGEFHKKRPFSVSLEMLDDRIDLPAGLPVTWNVFGQRH